MVIFYKILTKKVEKKKENHQHEKIRKLRLLQKWKYQKIGIFNGNVFSLLLINFHQSTQKINKFVDFLENELENNWIPYDL
jgi:hypothetical protein